MEGKRNAIKAWRSDNADVTFFKRVSDFIKANVAEAELKLVADKVTTGQEISVGFRTSECSWKLVWELIQKLEGATDIVQERINQGR